MSNDKTTLADVQPGGRVTLGDQAERARFEAWASEHNYSVAMDGEQYEFAAARLMWKAWRAAFASGAAAAATGTVLVNMGDSEAEFIRANDEEAALSAQPSRGGQGDALDCIGRIEEAIEFRVPHDIYAAVHGELAELKAALAARQPVASNQSSGNSGEMPVDSQPAGEAIGRVFYVDRILSIEWRDGMKPVDGAMLYGARQPVDDQHPDDLAVDAFAAAMKAKMAEARAKGRGGWEDPAQCTADDLSRMLRDHVEKGDARDVANFCMMLHQRGEAISARQPLVSNQVLENVEQLGVDSDSQSSGNSGELPVDSQPVGEPDHLRGTTEMIGQPVGQIPAGFVLVPEKFGIPADVWEGVEFVIGGPGTGEGEAYLDSTAWIGDLMQDDGSSIYGLHLSCDECPEEGSVTLSVFTARAEVQP